MRFWRGTGSPTYERDYYTKIGASGAQLRPRWRVRGRLLLDSRSRWPNGGARGSRRRLRLFARHNAPSSIVQLGHYACAAAVVADADARHHGIDRPGEVGTFALGFELEA